MVTLLWWQALDIQKTTAHQGSKGAMQAFTATPTLISTTMPDPTPTATSVAFLLPIILHQKPWVLTNGNFEAGRVGWQETSLQHSILITQQGSLGGIVPHSGEWAVWLGGIKNEVASITQPVSITAAQPVLQYWLRSLSTKTECGGDSFTLLINRQTVVDHLLICRNTDRDWHARLVDLSPFIGQTLTLSWQIVTDATGQNSSVFLDDVALIPDD